MDGLPLVKDCDVLDEGIPGASRKGGGELGLDLIALCRGFGGEMEVIGGDE